MKFVHFADCHIDGFKDSRLAQLGNTNFKYVIDFSIKESTDFVLLAGDLFNTALPRVDALKFVTQQLKKLQVAHIPCYIIPGSHDYSPHGRTMLDVLELAGLVINVAKGTTNEEGKLELQFTHDKKTNTFITGIMGRAGMLDQQHYNNMSIPHLPNGKKIFMFHTAIHELKTPALSQMDASPIGILPAGFDYYAGGHVHIVTTFSNENYKNVVYPGPTFPNSFSELEDLKQGSFVYYSNGTHTHKTIPNKKVLSYTIDCDTLSSEEVYDKTAALLKKESIDDAIILLRFTGTLEDKSSDIDFKSIIQTTYDKGAYIVLRNTNKLQSKIFDEVVTTSKATHDVENESIKEHINHIQFNGSEEKTIKELLSKLSIEQLDGEKKTTFNERVIDIAQHILES